MSQQDVRTVTSFGEKLLQDHNDSYRKELGAKFEAIVTRLSTVAGQTAEQKSALESFAYAGRRIVEKAARILP